MRVRTQSSDDYSYSALVLGTAAIGVGAGVGADKAADVGADKAAGVGTGVGGRTTERQKT